MPQTPLHATHEKLGASFTDFGGWEMPLKYGSELEEHRAVRSAVGIFDLSHMGEISVQGPDAAAFLDYALISNFSVLKEGKAKYSMIVAEDGGIIDDLITYKFSDNHFMVVPNAANTAAVWAAFESRKGDFEVQLTNNSEAFALVAVQGPGSLAALQPLLSNDASTLSYYSGSWMTLDGIEIFVARTGDTGEDGFELFCAREDAQKVWDAVIGCGTPCGLASRDSLRLEASMPLYGNELSTEITPVEAGMGRAFAKKEADFVGKEALAGREPEVVIAGLTSEQRRAARAGAEIYLPGESGAKIGVVTSGQPSPTLGYPVALAHVAPEHAEVGTDVEIDIRGRRYPFTIVTTPFYSRKDA